MLFYYLKVSPGVWRRSSEAQHLFCSHEILGHNPNIPPHQISYYSCCLQDKILPDTMMLSSSSPVIFSHLHYSSALCPPLQTYKVTPKSQLPGDPQTSRSWHLLHAEPISFAHLLLPADISGLKSSISHKKTFLVLSLFSLPRRVSLSSALAEG